ncbi:PAS domain-containing protein [Burkholderia plantarii]|uniref:PAS domain-containing protein n=1 Tax=Burkholderia plantarii TaxID=41899 RepID=UPI001F5B0828|nr:PAS domain-containing protein [Burkholderia plantarii]
MASSADAVDARIDPRDLAAYRRSLRESAANLTPWRLEYRVWLPRQGLRWRQGEARPRRLPEGGTLWHGFITDEPSASGSRPNCTNSPPSTT